MGYLDENIAYRAVERIFYSLDNALQTGAMDLYGMEYYRIGAALSETGSSRGGPVLLWEAERRARYDGLYGTEDILNLNGFLIGLGHDPVYVPGYVPPKKPAPGPELVLL